MTMTDSVTAGAPVGAIDWLRGLRVLEVTTGVAAPLIGRVLGELGADVTKLESRAKLDVNRMRVPRPDDPQGFPASEAFQLLHEANAGKRSITLNLKEPAGKELFLELLQDTDVFIENFAPGWLERLGLSPAAITSAAPKLIMLSTSGYGQTGPLRSQRAYAPVMTSLSGIEGLIGYGPDEVTGACSLALADLNCTFYGVFLILAALRGLDGTGLGQYIDLSQTEAAASLIGEAFVEQQLGIRTPGPYGNAGMDGEQWTLLRAAEDDRWIAAGSDREQHDAARLTELGRQHERRSAAELLGMLADHGFESAPVLTPDEVAGDDLFARQGFLQRVTHPLEMIGELTITSVPWHLDGIVPRVSGAAPLLGQDTEQFFRRRLTAEDFAKYSEGQVFH
jgi:crotonobetainyl-CoA:carnitine CoA-transferase CaiB-like acyl-CoA transferase